MVDLCSDFRFAFCFAFFVTLIRLNFNNIDYNNDYNNDYINSE